MSADQHPLYAVIPDPSGMPPLCGPEEFEEEMAAMVAQLGGGVHLGMASAELALRWGRVGTRVTPPLVWVDQVISRQAR